MVDLYGTVKGSVQLGGTGFHHDATIPRFTLVSRGDLDVYWVDLLRLLTGAEVESANCRVQLCTVVSVKDGAPMKIDDDALVTGGTDFTPIASKSSARANTGIPLQIRRARSTAGPASWMQLRGSVFFANIRQ